MTDNKGPRIDPRGTPMSTLLQEQVGQLSNSFYYHLKHQKKEKIENRRISMKYIQKDTLILQISNSTDFPQKYYLLRKIETCCTI